MKVTIDDKSGFCFGVVRAIGMAEEALQAGRRVYSLGDIVHNRIEVQRLSELGLTPVGHDTLEGLKESVVLIRAHGEPPATYIETTRNGNSIIDATCPVVAQLQKKVTAAYAAMKPAGGLVVILGKKGHAEVVGLAGQVDGDVIVIESLSDAAELCVEGPVHLLSQTTQSLSLFRQVREIIEAKMPEGVPLTVEDTICRQVANREPHLQSFAREHDVVIFVSGRKSSNGKALYEVCHGVNPRTYMVEDETELTAEMVAGAENTGVCGATSTPKWLMERVANKIKTL